MRVAVLGGGLQGACVAMALASAEVEVDLYDRNAECMTQASARNEGKIHLGYVYAQDRSLRTARTMIRGAAAFSRLLRRWIGRRIDAVPVSQPFDYVVHRDSLLAAEEVQRHLAACSEIARTSAGREADYFGMDLCEPPARLRQFDQAYDGRAVTAAFKTPEVGIDPEALAGAVRATLSAEPNIHCVTAAEVQAVELADGHAEVVFARSGDLFREGYDHVVNALWDGRLSIDATLGIEPPRPWLFRFKHYARIRPSTPIGAVGSATIVLGPFGDIVSYRNGELYLSWYPAGMTDTSDELTPPRWPQELDDGAARAMFEAIVAGLAPIAPQLGSLAAADAQSYSVKGGVIVAWGTTDIDDPESELHERADIGPQRYGRYHTINTGKLTMAPLFGQMTADEILATQST